MLFLQNNLFRRLFISQHSEVEKNLKLRLIYSLHLFPINKIKKIEIFAILQK